MNETELRLSSIIGPMHEVDWSSTANDRVWSRIATTYRRRRRQRALRLVGGALVLSSCLIVTGLVYLPGSAGRADINWQARAQALELQLDALSSAGSSAAPASAMDVSLQSSLSRLDSRLQAAYDRGAAPDELSSLWKQRSELLSDLLRARKGRLIRI